MADLWLQTKTSSNVPICREPAEDVEMKIMTSSAAALKSLSHESFTENELELKMKLHLQWELGANKCLTCLFGLTKPHV